MNFETVSETKVDAIVISTCMWKGARASLQSNTGPVDQLSRTDQRDPPIQELDGGRRDGEVGETSDEKHKKNRYPRHTVFVDSAEDLGSLTLLRHTKHGPRGGKDERVGGGENRDEDQGIDQRWQERDLKSVHCYFISLLMICF